MTNQPYWMTPEYRRKRFTMTMEDIGGFFDKDGKPITLEQLRARAPKRVAQSDAVTEEGPRDMPVAGPRSAAGPPFRTGQPDIAVTGLPGAPMPLKAQRETPRHGQAALNFKGKTYTADFHAEALDKLLTLNGYPKAKAGGIDQIVRDHPEADNLTSDHWGGIDKTGQYVPFTKELGESLPMPIDLHRSLGGRVDLRELVRRHKSR